MYLVLLDNSLITPDDLKALIEQFDAEADIIYSYSTETLLKIAENLQPKIIIVDFDLIKEHRTVYFEILREKSRGAYVLVITDPQYFETLATAVEHGGIDSYIAKPLRKQELVARIHIANKRKGLVVKKTDQKLVHREGEMVTETPSAQEISDQVSEEKIPAPEEDYLIPTAETEEFDYSPPAEEELPKFEEREHFGENIPEQQHERDRAEQLLGGESSDIRNFNDMPPVREETVSPIPEPSHEPEGQGDSFTGIFDDIIIDQEPKRDEAEIVALAEEDKGEPDFTPEFLFPQEKMNIHRRDLEATMVKPAEEFLPQEMEPVIPVESGVKGVEEYMLSTDIAYSPRSRSEKRKKSGGGFARLLSALGNIVLILALIGMAVISFFLIQGRLSDEAPQLAGYRFYIVQGGSMSPQIEAGSLVFVREIEPGQVVEGDIITFHSEADADVIITHRVAGIVSENGLRFITRGDAGIVNDPRPVEAESVIGRVTAMVPYMGGAIEFAQTRQGLISLIIVPGALIVIFELVKITRYMSKGSGEGKVKKKRIKAERKIKADKMSKADKKIKADNVLKEESD